MSTETPTYVEDYPISLVRPHPRNVRHEAIADDDMVASVASGGIDTPVTLGPADENGIRYLIAGNRRYDAALKAGRDVLPARFRDDLVTDQQQVEAMIRENIHRKDLTVIEQAEAFEQLQLFGADVATINEITGVSRKVVKERLKLVALPDTAKTKLHAGDASIVDALQLLEFEDDHEIHATLVDALGTPDFAWKARNARDTLRRRASNAEKIAEFHDLGAAAASEDDTYVRLTSFHTADLREPAAHTHCECLGYDDYGLDSYTPPYLVCLAPDSHSDEATATAGGPTADDIAQREANEAKWEADRIAREERTAAAAVRVAAIRTTLDTALRGLKGKPATLLAGAAQTALPVLLHDGDPVHLVGTGVWAAAFDLDVDNPAIWRDVQAASEEYALAVHAGPTTDALSALAGLLAALIDTVLTGDKDTVPGGTADVISSAWEWLEGTGYQLSSIDEQVRTTALTED